MIISSSPMTKWVVALPEFQTAKFIPINLEKQYLELFNSSYYDYN